MTEIDFLPAVAQVGFPIATAAFLLWKGYTLEKEHLTVLMALKDDIAQLRMEYLKVLVELKNDIAQLRKERTGL